MDVIACILPPSGVPIAQLCGLLGLRESRHKACVGGQHARPGSVHRRSDQLRTMLPTYQELVAKQALRILVFSGLYDGMEPHLGTELWLAKLNLTVKAPARSWFDPLVRPRRRAAPLLAGLDLWAKKG